MGKRTFRDFGSGGPSILKSRRRVLGYGAALALFNMAGGPVMAQPLKILALGDSLTAGYGVAAAEAFPVRLEAALKAQGLDITVINAGVSGDTTAGGRARLDWALADKPQMAIVELGANDGLRGIDPKVTKANLEAILAKLETQGVEVLLAGMLAPPNYGRDFEAEFKSVFDSLAASHKVVFYPFFLDGVAGHPHLNQPDGLHPTAQGVDEIVKRILPSVRVLVDRFMGKTRKSRP